MKFKTNFKDLREAVVTIGKAVKKNMSPIEISLVKIEACENYVELSQTVQSVPASKFRLS